jgi:hypothetical protein
MKNRSTMILALLEANGQFHTPEVHRTMLVKQAFLVETLRPVYQIWLRTFPFIRYRYGPYAEEIFHELDALIFNGLVAVHKFEKDGGRIEARYGITEFGKRNLRDLGGSELVALSSDLVWALESLGIDQVTKICGLVYKEPEFAQLLTREREQGRGPEDRLPLPAVTDANNQTFLTLALIEGILQRQSTRIGGHLRLSSREVVRIYLQILSSGG